MGGRLLSFYNSFGEYHGLVIYEAPDESAAAAIVLTATFPGHLSRIKTTVLLSAEEGVEAMRKAGGRYIGSAVRRKGCEGGE